MELQPEQQSNVSDIWTIFTYVTMNIEDILLHRLILKFQWENVLNFS